jgi:hypothetical protein
MKFEMVKNVLACMAIPAITFSVWTLHEQVQKLELKSNQCEKKHLLLQGIQLVNMHETMQVQQQYAQLAKRVHEQDQVIQAWQQKTIYDGIYEELDRVYDRAASLWITAFSSSTVYTTTTTNNNNNIDATIPSEYHQELALPEPPNVIATLNPALFLLLSMTTTAGTAPPPPQAPTMFTTETMSSAYASMNLLCEHVVETVVPFIKNVLTLSFLHEYGFEMLLPPVMFLEEQCGVPRQVGSLVIITTFFAWLFCLGQSVHQFVTNPTMTSFIAIFAACYGTLKNFSGFEMFAFCDLLHGLSHIYLFGTLCVDLYERSSNSNLCAILRVLIGRVVKRRFGTETSLVIRQSETVRDIAAKFDWMCVINLLAKIDLRRCQAIHLASVDINCFFEACLQVLGLDCTANREHVIEKSNLLLERVQRAHATTNDVRVTRRLINKLVSMFGNATSIGAVEAQSMASYIHILKTCPLQDMPTVLRRVKEYFVQPHWPPMAVIEMANLDRLQRQYYINHVCSETERVLARIQAIMRITDLNRADKRQVERNLNRLRLVHHPDKGGQRKYYNFLNDVMDYVNRNWFFFCKGEKSIGFTAEALLRLARKTMLTCSMSTLQMEYEGFLRYSLAMPDESEHFQLVVVQQR